MPFEYPLEINKAKLPKEEVIPKSFGTWKEETKKALEKAKIYKMIREAPRISSLNEESAPFRDFDKNTDTLWKYVPAKEVEKYLKSKLFFDTDLINREDREFLTMIDEDGNAIKIPINLIVCVQGFEDWRGRGEGVGKDWQIKNRTGDSSGGRMESRDVVKLYAGSHSELPPVSRMGMYIQPDGKIFFDNQAGDSHRIAAAILRGDKYIGAKNLAVYKLNKNFI